MLYGGNVHILNLGCKLAVFTASKVVFSTFFFSVNLVSYGRCYVVSYLVCIGTPGFGSFDTINHVHHA